MTDALIAEQCVGLPSETVYGLAGNAFSESSVRAIFSAKGRPFYDPLIIHLSQTLLGAVDFFETLLELGLVSETGRRAREKLKSLKCFWPGPLTVVLPKGRRISKLVTAGLETVALRVPSHPVFQEILSRVEFPLAAPSANRFGRVSPTSALAVLDELGGKIPFILDGGPCAHGMESTVLFLSDDESVVLRAGAVTFEELQFVLGDVRRTQGHLGSLMSPGMLESHYAPMKPVRLKAEIVEIPSEVGVLRLKGRDGKEAARNFYAELRMLDQNEGVREIWIEEVSLEFRGRGIWAAIEDRLKRIVGPTNFVQDSTP